MGKLILGTVQLGLSYGINNQTGKPGTKEAEEILQCAYDLGITTRDTATAYGNSEEVLGAFIHKQGIKNNVNIISKLLPNIFDTERGKKDEIIEKHILKSIDTLHIDKLYGYLLHTPAYIYDDDIITGLQKAKDRGLIQHFGVSTYEPAEALYAVENNLVDMIQVPYNIFDQRLDKEDFFEKAKKNNIEVFVRTVYVQGLVLMDKKDIPIHLQKVIPYLDKLDMLLAKYAVSRKEALMLFVKQQKCIENVVVGLETVGQLEENLNIRNTREIPNDLIQELQKEFGNINDVIFFPSLWAKK